MNVAFFLTPKTEVIYEKIDATMRQVLERMEYHRYTAIPLIDNEGTVSYTHLDVYKRQRERFI